MQRPVTEKAAVLSTARLPCGMPGPQVQPSLLLNSIKQTRCSNLINAPPWWPMCMPCQGLAIRACPTVVPVWLLPKPRAQRLEQANKWVPGTGSCVKVYSSRTVHLATGNAHMQTCASTYSPICCCLAHSLGFFSAAAGLAACLDAGFAAAWGWGWAPSAFLTRGLSRRDRSPSSNFVLLTISLPPSST